ISPTPTRTDPLSLHDALPISGIAAGHRPHRRRRAADRRFRELRGMGVAGGLVGNRAQPEPLGSIEARAFDAAVVECQALGLAVLDRKSTRLNSSHLGISYAVF